MRIAVQVTLDVPEGATRADVCAYLEDAIKGWAGSLMPQGCDGVGGVGGIVGGGGGGGCGVGDPMFHLDRDSVRVGVPMVVKWGA